MSNTDSVCTLIDLNEFPSDDSKDIETKTKDTHLELADGETLCLPSNVPIHEGLLMHPHLEESARKMLQSQMIHTFNPNISEASAPVVYVHQREVAHVSSEQYNNRGAVLTSDAETTCHVLALRSFTDKNATNGESKVLGSLCHLDSSDSGLQRCIWRMIQKHVNYHKKTWSTSIGDGDQSKLSRKDRVSMEVHVIGGFNDKDGTSIGITDFIFSRLEAFSKELKTKIRFQLKTCIVSGLNDVMTYEKASESKSAPIVRGMTLDVCSGKIKLLHSVHSDLFGPEPILRRARLWTANNDNSLQLVHDAREDRVIIKPFKFTVFAGMENIPELPDPIMLQYTSTSPDCEADGYCDDVREVIRFLLSAKEEDFFSSQGKALKYQYNFQKCGTNLWDADGS